MEGATTAVDISSISDALISGLNEASVAMIGTLVDLLPVALTVVTSVLVVSYGIKIFKKVTGR